MSKQSKEEYLESSRTRYAGRGRKGKSVLIDEVSDCFGWSRKHTIKALNRQVSYGKHAGKRGSKPTYTEVEKKVIVEIWKRSEQPCGVLLKSTLPLWIASYEKEHGKLRTEVRKKVLRCSPRQLDRITSAHKIGSGGRRGRRTGRSSHRLKTTVPVKCGPWDVDEPGHLEADTVSHGGGSSSGEFMHSLTLTDIHTGWTELAAQWGLTGGAVCQALQRIESRMPFEMESFDCDNGSEFLNTTLEYYLLSRTRTINWTRSRAYKKNDQAHVEQKNYTHVRQLLGYGRYDDIELVEMVNDLYENAWLPLRNYFTPVMKLVEKKREGSKVKKRYDTPKTPCDRLLECSKVSGKLKKVLRARRKEMDPLKLSAEVEKKLKSIHKRIEDQERKRAEEESWMEEDTPAASAGSGSVPALGRYAPSASTPPAPAETLAKTPKKKQKRTTIRVS